MDKMNGLLLTVFIIIAISCGSGHALRCYKCEQSPFLCRSNITCSEEEDVCLQIRFLHLRTYGCWKSSLCSHEDVARAFDADSFRSLCCQRDFCNRSPDILVSTAPLSISAVTVIWTMMYL